MFKFGTTNESRYMRITSLLSANKALRIPNESSVRYFDQVESNKLVEAIQKRNIYARHSWENHFYIDRIKALANHTIIEVILEGDPNEIAQKAEEHTELLGKLAVLSTTIALEKYKLHKKLNIGLHPDTQIDFILGNNLHFLKSRSKPTFTAKALEIDERFSRRFFRHQCDILYQFCLDENELSQRVRRAVEWLFESRLEISIASSIVKSAIALETLLIFSETESLSRSLSERIAFIVSSSPHIREQVSTLIKRFYEARSGVVHGSRKKARKVSPRLLEAVDRITFLLLTTIGTNNRIWPTTERLQQWCETQRWGEPSSELVFPFQEVFLERAIKLGNAAT